MKKNLLKKVIRKGFRRTLFLLLGPSLLLPSCAHKEPSLTGTLTGVDTDTLLAFVSHMNERKSFRTDTIALVNNSFELQLPDSSFYISLVPKPATPNGALRMARTNILFFPGDRLKVEGSIEHYKVSGSELYDGMKKYPEIDRMSMEIDSLNEAYRKAYIDHDEVTKVHVKKEVKDIYTRLQNAKFEIVKSEPGSMTSAYYACQLTPEKGLEAISILTEDVKKSLMKKMLDKAKLSYEKALIREQSKSDIQEGKIAPDFRLNTIDGTEITLASFQGKYLLIDFWGTWCGWCIKGIPNMKKAYEKYRGKVEFLGVCCGDTEQKWREGVAFHQLPWINVLEGESNLSARYAVSGYPTKVLLDTKGMILKLFVGETPELYSYMDKLFCKTSQ